MVVKGVDDRTIVYQDYTFTFYMRNKGPAKSVQAELEKHK